MAKKIAAREGVGDLLAEGTYRAALKIGKMKHRDLLKYAVQSKGIGIGAHGIRSEMDFSNEIAFACSVQGGDHSSMTSLPLDGYGSEIWEVFYDSAIMCKFTCFGFPENSKFELYSAITGLNLTRNGWAKNGGLKTLQIQRVLLLLGGPDLTWNPKVDDDNPSRFYEPLPSGPCKGKAADKMSVREGVQKYYEEAGWDANGIPESSTLVRLGLSEVDKALKKLREMLDKHV